MTYTDNDSSAAHDKRSLLYPLMAITLALAWILWPFFGAVFWGCSIALLSAPLNRWLLRRYGFRRTPAVVLIVVVLPFVLMTLSPAREAPGIYLRVQPGELNPTQYLRHVFNALLTQGTQFMATRPCA